MVEIRPAYEEEAFRIELFGDEIEALSVTDPLTGKVRRTTDSMTIYPARHFVTPEPYAGHLGLDGVGDTKGLMESELRERHIRWTCNAKITAVEDGKMQFTEFDEDGNVILVSENVVLTSQPAGSFMQRIEDCFFMHLPIEDEM